MVFLRVGANTEILIKALKNVCTMYNIQEFRGTALIKNSERIINTFNSWCLASGMQ